MTTTTASDPLVGRLLDGRYQITERLARGGMATVYAAVDTRLTRTVAVKVMHIGLGDDADFARKFDREARAAARLSHPNVVSVFDQGQDRYDGDATRPYIVMEYVEGRTLRDVISNEAPLPAARALETMEPVLAALACAHDAGLVHRDIKPENVLISRRGQLKVADFGLAKAVSSQTSTATQGLLIGTVSYLPPELVVSGKADARSDVYSAGVVLFELLTGRKPHTGETPIQVAYAHVHTDVPAPSSFPTAGPIPAQLDALVARATARDAAQRPQDAKALLAEVRRVRAGLDTDADPEATEDLSGRFADFQVTQVVAPARSHPRTPLSPASPPTVVHAPPPGRHPRQADAAAEPDDRDVARRRWQARRRRRGLIALLLVVLLACGAAGTGWYLTSGRFSTAPELAGLNRPDAEQTAAGAGLQVRFDEAYSETVPPGLVVGTDPAPGSRVRRGGEIEAAVSKGPERHPMPGVVGLSQAAAEAAVQRAELAVGQVRPGFSDTVGTGLVLSASRTAGTPLPPNTAVDLVVSQGPKPIPITDYTGKSADKAVAALKKAGFAVEQKKAHSDTVDKGDVIRQSPDHGDGTKGDTVTLTRSLGPVLVTVPYVKSMGVRAAEQVMRDAGFKTRVRAARVNYLGVGFVAYTTPGARGRAPRGSTITLYIV